MMKKTLLSTTIAVFLSLTSVNIQAENDWESELDSLSAEYSDIDLDQEMGNLSSLLGEGTSILLEGDLPKENKEIVKKESNITIAKEDKVKVKTEEKQEKTKQEVKQEIDEEDDAVVFFEPTPTIKTETMESETDFVFLRNIPEGTRITVGENYTVLPKKRFIIFEDGERVGIERLKSSQTIENPEAKFCFIELVNSGSARILKKGKKLIITSNRTEIKEYNLKRSYGDYVLRTHQYIFGVDNKNIRNLTCYSAESYEKNGGTPPKPLTLKDFRLETGGVFKIDFPAYEEI